MPLKYETVAVPVVSGIDVSTKARLVGSKSLLEALNSRLGGGGASKRRGHAGYRVRGSKLLPLDVPQTAQSGADGIPSDWLFGWGPLTGTTRADPEVLLGTSDHPDAGILFGATSRDAESLLWNGHQLFSRAPGQATGAPFATPGSAVIPSLTATPVAKGGASQRQPDIAQTTSIRVVAWIDADDVHLMVQDVTTGAALQEDLALGYTAATRVRCIPVGDWVHVLVADDDLDELVMTSIHSSAPRTRHTKTLGPCSGFFDSLKISESEWVVAKNQGDNTVLVVWYDPDGSPSSTPASTPSLGIPTAVYSVAIAYHAGQEKYSLVFRAEVLGVVNVYGRTYDKADGNAGSLLTLSEAPVGYVTRPVAVAAKYLTDESDNPVFDAYWDDTDLFAAVPSSAVMYAARYSDTVLTHTTRHWLALTSQAFAVGDRTFVWAGQKSPLQTTWLLLDEALLPVGKTEFATANLATNDMAAIALQSSVNWTTGPVLKDITEFHCARGFNVRLQVDAPDVGTNVPAIYAEPSTRLVTLNFLPRLRAAQAGRTAYLAGAQLWAYDGVELVEANFHICPEPSLVETPTVASSGGALTADGRYQWRVDLCHRNAQNEEVHSHSFYTDGVTLSGVNQTVTVTVPTCITRRTGSYLLFYRNNSTGVQWYLANSRDPASADYVANDLDNPTASFVDAGQITDAVLVSREQHPANSGFGYLDQFSAPACEVISGGVDRLWLAGGEIEVGQVMPSRLFNSGSAPAFNGALAIQVDRGVAPITAVGFVGESTYIFRANSVYVQGGSGPDNTSNGYWDASRLAYADTGALSQESLALIASGLLFQSPAGFRLLGQGAGLQPIGQAVDPVAQQLDVAGVVVSTADQEVRWYARSGDSLVYNYQYDTWATWSLAVAGCTRNPATGLAILAAWNGYLLEETEGVWLDNGHPYLHRIRFPWLRAKDLMDFQAVRRIGALGEASEAHQVHVEVFYDEREFAEEVFNWNFPDDAADPSWNTDTFGTASFGDGLFGETS